MPNTPDNPIHERDDEEWLTADELSKRLGISKSTIYRSARANKIRSKKEGNKLYFLNDPANIVALASKHNIPRTSFFRSRIVKKIYNHPWFILIAGISSILGLALAIYAIWPTKAPQSSVINIGNSPSPFPLTTPEVATVKRDEWDSSVGNAYKEPMGRYVPGKYRVRYIVFHGRSFMEKKSPIFGLLHGSVKETTYDLFDKEPYVLKTEPLAILERLSKRFPDFYDDDENLSVFSSNTSSNRIQQVFNEDPHYYLITPKGERSYYESGSGSEIHTESVFGLIGSNNIQHLAGDYPQIPQIVPELIKNNPDVPDIAMEELSFQVCDGDWMLRFASRPFKMLILDIENLDSQPLQIDYVKGPISRSEDLHLSLWGSDKQVERTEERYDFPLKVW